MLIQAPAAFESSKIRCDAPHGVGTRKFGDIIFRCMPGSASTFVDRL